MVEITPRVEDDSNIRSASHYFIFPKWNSHSMEGFYLNNNPKMAKTESGSCTVKKNHYVELP